MGFLRFIPGGLFTFSFTYFFFFFSVAITDSLRFLSTSNPLATKTTTSGLSLPRGSLGWGPKGIIMDTHSWSGQASPLRIKLIQVLGDVCLLKRQKNQLISRLLETASSGCNFLIIIISKGWD